MVVSTFPAQSVIVAPHQVGGSHDVAGEPSKLQGAGAPSSCFGSLENHSTKAQGSRLSFTQHSQSVLRAKDMILMFLYGLEMFLDVYEVSWDSSNLQMAG